MTEPESINPMSGGDEPSHIVAIGASAGGIEALEKLTEALPMDTGMAFVIVQHLAPNFESMMDQLLARRTKLPVATVRRKTAVKANHIYLLPEGHELIISGNELQPVEPLRDRARHLPIDRFFASLAHHWRDRAIGVVLSGTGSDGSAGVRDIHAHGGLVIAQSAGSAGFDSMPNNAVATGVVDLVLPPEHIPSALIDVRESRPPTAPTPTTSGDPIFEKVFALLRTQFGIDFNYYKIDTVARRVERRMYEADLTDVAAYATHLEANPEELNRLYRDLLIGVTEFFRDHEAWSFLEQNVLPSVLALAREQGELRVWAAGCATGEEVYTLAILITEALAREDLHLPVKIFATDVHQRSLDFAANGMYSEKQVQGVSPARLEKHFSRVSQGYMIKPDLRKKVVFARQDITRDPPFTKMSLVVCRNMLIYLNPAAQQKVLAMFHFALFKGGYLFLGSSEALGDIVNDFSVESSRYKIFSKRTERRIAAASFRVPSIRPPARALQTDDAPGGFGRGLVAGRSANLIRAYDVLMEEYMPPSILVSGSGEIAHSFGTARRFLRPQSGVATLYLSELIVPDLRLAVISALQKVQHSDEKLLYAGLRVTVDDVEERVNLHVRTLSRVDGHEASYVLLSFEAASPPPTKQATEREVDHRSLPEDRMQDLETELRYTKEHLQTAVEDLETSNEELQATNEELMAANEELQSTNEELHSVNEELYTVNREYETKIDELTVLTSDMDNMLKSSGIGTLFLDHELRIRKFTPAAAQKFNLIEQDVGRPLVHLQHHIDFPDLQVQLQRVLDTEQPFEREARDRAGVMLLLRITPYRDSNDEVSGVIITFVNVDRLISSSQELQRAHEQLQEFAYAVSHALHEPTRQLLSAGAELMESLDDRLRSEEREKLAAAQQAAEASAVMIRALLEYSRVETEGGAPAATDSEGACTEAVAKLSARIDATGAQIYVGSLPPVLADRAQLVQVFHHLLENAIACGPAPARIHVSGDVDGGVATFRVTDEGHGMTPGAIDRAFRVFGLSADRRLPESGSRTLGLPVCRRIIERNGGKIWIESTVGEGTTIYFTLRKAD